MADSWIQSWLKDWALWVETIEAYPGDTVIARAMNGQLSGGNFGSSVPRGVEPNDNHIKKLTQAMRVIADNPKHKKYIVGVQLCYLFGQRKACAELKKSQPTISRYRDRGEQLLESYLRG